MRTTGGVGRLLGGMAVVYLTVWVLGLIASIATLALSVAAVVWVLQHMGVL